MKKSRSASPPGEESPAEKKIALQKYIAEQYGDEPSPPPVTSGPIYELKDDSLVLWRPEESQMFDKMTNPSGFVPVIVHPSLVDGDDSRGDSQPLTITQKDGLQKMWNFFDAKKGCILAHEMGLGKTRISVTLVATLLEQSNRKEGKSTPGIRKCIIIVPKHAVSVWRDEFAIWCPANMDINKHIVTVFSHERDNLDKIMNFNELEEQNVLILSYESFRKHKPDMKDYKVGIDLILCDEAHILKNSNTGIVRLLKELREFDSMKDAVWMGITGTPYQNNIEQYCNLVELFQPGTFEPKYKPTCTRIQNQFKKDGKLSKESHSDLVNIHEKSKGVVEYAPIGLNIEANEIILCIPFQKPSSGSSGPEKLEKFTTLQYSLYKNLSDKFQSLKSLNHCPKFDLFQKICINPLLALESKAGLKAFATYNATRAEFKDLNDETNCLISKKIQVLARVVVQILSLKTDEKVIIASHFVEMLKFIEKTLLKFQNKVKFGIVFFTGETNESNREKALSKFKNEDTVRVLLMSYAGSTSLTIIRANHLFCVDPDYNPSFDKQLIGRIYRTGQTRNIFIYRMVCTGTIEEVKFLYQLSKDEVKVFFENTEAAGQSDLRIAQKWQQALHHYYSDTPSHIRDIVKDLKPQRDSDAGDEENYDVDPGAKALAEELSNAGHFATSNKIPEELSMIKKVWERKNENLSFVFHIKRKRDLAGDILLQGDAAD